MKFNKIIPAKFLLYVDHTMMRLFGKKPKQEKVNGIIRESSEEISGQSKDDLILQLQQQLTVERANNEWLHTLVDNAQSVRGSNVDFTKDFNLFLKEQFANGNQVINSLIDHMHAGILFCDSAGVVIKTNSEFVRLFSDFETLFTNVDQVISAIKPAFKDPEAFEASASYLRNHRSEVISEEFYLKDDCIILCEFISVHSQDQYVGQLWQITDVTAERMAKFRIKKSEEKYRSIIENLDLGMLEVDLNHIILKSYDSFCKMTGYTQMELLGQNALDLFLDESTKKQMMDQDRLRGQGKQGVYEIQMRKKSGEKIWVLISGAPLFDLDENVIGSIGIHYDITQRKKLEQELLRAREEAERSQMAERQFLANMSHEIRNPLNAIIGINNLLYDSNPSAEQINYLNIIKQSSDILMGLISDVLDFSKITSGHLELSEKPINIFTQVDSLLQIVGFNTKKKIAFKNLLEKSEDFDVVADQTVINQIFLNLLSNALKFTESGVICVMGKKLRDIDDLAEFEFSVCDTGIGIPENRQAEIFGVFKQADQETKLKYGGTGLGLSIVRNLILQYGGNIKVESEVDKGSTFRFTMILKTAKVEPTVQANDQFEVIKKGRLLIVEDNKMNQQYISGVIKAMDLEHDIANNGVEALEFLDAQYYNLIFMDIRMPKMDGYETTIRLRSNINNPNQKVPIIALTASALIDEKERALASGMNYHITKPYTPNDLAEALVKFDIISRNSGEKIDNNPKIELDDELLRQFYGDNISRAKIMFELFLNTTKPEFEQLKSYFENKDWESFRDKAHTLKSTFAMVGLGELSVRMNQLQYLFQDDEIKSFEEADFKIIERNFNRGLELVAAQLTKINQQL